MAPRAVICQFMPISRRSPCASNQTMYSGGDMLAATEENWLVMAEENPSLAASSLIAASIACLLGVTV